MNWFANHGDNKSMKKAWKNKGTLIALGILSGILLVFFLVSIILELGVAVELPYTFDYLFLGIVVILFLLAYLIRDIGLNRYRKKNKLWTGKLPSEIVEKNWTYVLPFLASALFGVFLEILYYFVKWIFSF